MSHAHESWAGRVRVGGCPQAIDQASFDLLLIASVAVVLIILGVVLALITPIDQSQRAILTHTE